MALIMKNNAQKIFTKLGGANVAASVAGVKIQTAYRWTYPKERGGTDGKIPYKYHNALLDYANLNHLDLEPVDFVN